MTLLHIIGEDISRIVPLLYAYKEQAKRHLLLCDDDRHNVSRAKILQKGMRYYSDTHHLDWTVEIIKVNEDSYENMVQQVDEVCMPKDELWLNITDGYPAMAVLLSNYVHECGGKVVSYDHFDNDLHIIGSDGTMYTYPLDSKIDIESYLSLLDYRIISKSNMNLVKQRKKKVFDLYKDEEAYTKVKKALVRQMHDPEYRFDFTPYEDTLQILQSLKIVNSKGKLIRHQQKVLQGDLLEEYLYWQCHTLEPDDVMLGVKIDLEASKNTHPYPKLFNEFDLLIMNDNRLYTVECKFSDGLDGLDVVYKYDSIIDYFGSASKAIIVNISKSSKVPYMGMNSSKNFSHSTLRRARRSNIAIYHETKVDVVKFQNLVKAFFHIKRESD